MVPWDRKLSVSGSVIIQVAEDGALIGHSSISRLPVELLPGTIEVLRGFAGGATPRTVSQALSDEWEIDESELAEVVEGLLEQGFLVGADDGASVPADEGFGIWSHFYMLSDFRRVLAYKAAISRHVRDRVVVELGCGTGVLSLLAARAGARRVIAIEENAIADVARELFHANGCDDRIDLRLSNSADVTLDEKADVLIHEILGDGVFNENLLPAIRDARKRLLKPEGLLIPSRLEVFCVGLEVPESYRLQTRLERCDALSELFDIDLGPLTRRLSRAGYRFLVNPLRGDENRSFLSSILTDELRLYDIDLAGDSADLEAEVDGTFEVSQRGNLDGALLYFKAHLDQDLSITNAPNAPATSWGWDVRSFPRGLSVEPGDRIPVKALLETRFGEQRLTLRLGS